MKNLLLTALVVISSIAFSSSALAMSQPQSDRVAKVAKATKVNKVNLNTAGAKELADALKGVGMKKAEAIVAYRKMNGDFDKIEDLAAVKGIGVATIAKNESVIILK